MSARKPPGATKKAASRRRTPKGELLVTKVNEAVAAMPWLTPADQATVALARSYAGSIDDAVASGDEEAAARALFLGPHLLNTMRALGGTPGDRKKLGVEEATGGKLAQLRAIRGGAA